MKKFILLTIIYLISMCAVSYAAGIYQALYGEGSYGTTVSGTIGGYNATVVGSHACEGCGPTTGIDFTGVGSFVGQYNTGAENTFIGALAGYSNTTGNNNTFVGSASAALDVDGYANTAIGVSSMGEATGGAYNNAMGNSSLNSCIGCSYNVALGGGAENLLTYGNGNVSAGWLSLYSTTSGNNNVAVGYQAGQNYPILGSHNVFIGDNSGATSDQSYSVAIGANVKTTADHQILLGTTSENIVIPGNLSITGSVTCGSGCTGSATNGPAFRAHGNTTSIASGTLTKAIFSTIDRDTNSNFSSSKFTPTIAGTYRLSSEEFFASLPSTQSRVLITIYKNGSEASRGSDGYYMYQGGLNVSDEIHFNGTTDYAEIYLYQVSGSSQSTSDNGGFTSYFSGSLARAD